MPSTTRALPDNQEIRHAALSAELARRRAEAAWNQLATAYSPNHARSQDACEMLRFAAQHLHHVRELLTHPQRARLRVLAPAAAGVLTASLTGVLDALAPAAAVIVGCAVGSGTVITTRQLVEARHEARLAAIPAVPPYTPTVLYPPVSIGRFKDHIRAAERHFQATVELTTRLRAVLPLSPATEPETEANRRIYGAGMHAVFAEQWLTDAAPEIHQHLAHAESL
ncbi:hypothetical protein GCM10022225_61490 [Plantactinospora mayteni]|uniref:Uncharacterized protein n=1 Tax=Plantactinospora mayteni TaxID=566021 RepID=A0ABQ4EZM4_9ACTN|nr:hypothetical protein [Plantactinospora mayteni]GIH00109.1 hypothetical protein Pma05_66810 [Plantactinospora mayteni]